MKKKYIIQEVDSKEYYCAKDRTHPFLCNANTYPTKAAAEKEIQKKTSGTWTIIEIWN